MPRIVRALPTALAAAVGVGICLLPPGVAAQQPVFRAETDVVPVYVTVRDTEGRAVTTLTADDFLIRVDGRESPIATFSNEPQPFAAVLLVDFSASMSAHRRAVRDATAEFVARLLPGDRVRLGAFSNRIVLAPDVFTGERHALLDALRWQVSHVDAGGASPVWLAARQSLDALESQPLRRVLVMLSDGHDAPGRGQGGVSDTAVVRLARHANVLVYALGFVHRRAALSAYDRPVVHGPNPRLEALADHSGGRFFEIDRSPDFTRLFTDIIDELHSQYLIGVPVEVRDGRRHRLEVRLRQRGLRVRAPESFVARR